ncbi:MAG: tetratricopeptide repeat protein [Candidatus Rifleibacteriota bacterium]
MKTILRTLLVSIILFIFSIFPFRPSFGENAAIGLSPEQIEEIEIKVEPVLKGNPVTEIPEADRPLLFTAEELFPDSFELFFRHGEYLANEKKDFRQAIPRLKKALELKEKDLKTLELLAACHCALKQSADEVSCWETLRELLEDDEAPELQPIKEKVFLNLERMANENEMMMRQGRRFIIYTPASSNYSHVDLELTDDRLEEVFRQVTNDLACIPGFRTSIIVLDPVKFEEVKPTSWAGGFARGEKSMIVPAEAFPKSDPDSILPAKKLLLHEFTHNIIFILGGGKCPTWLNEGLAVFAEHKDDSFTEFKPIIPQPDQLMNLNQLEKEFAEIRSLPASSPRVANAYNLAGLYARFLVQSFTMAGPRQIINMLKSNKRFEQALDSVCKLSMPEFEKKFRNWINELAMAN